MIVGTRPKFEGFFAQLCIIFYESFFFQLTGIVNSKYAPRGGRHPDIQFFFGGYYASCGDGETPDPSKINDIEERRSVS